MSPVEKLKGLILPLSFLSLFFFLGIFGFSSEARAEYRAYQLEVIDLLDCQLNKRKECKRLQINTAMSPDLYIRTHGGIYRIGVLMMATWICRGDTSQFRSICPKPTSRKPKFSVGDTVKITLKKHVSESWVGKIEVAYYQASVGSNVYGVRFENREDIYARYFEKDLVKTETKSKTGQDAAQRNEPPQ